MTRSGRPPIWKGLATGIPVLMLTLSVAVPVLERGTLVDRPVAENEHDPGDCPSGHDHTVCTQVGANLAVGGDDVDGPAADGFVVLSRVVGLDVHTARSIDRANPSRAPPLA